MIYRVDLPVIRSSARDLAQLKMANAQLMRKLRSEAMWQHLPEQSRQFRSLFPKQSQAIKYDDHRAAFDALATHARDEMLKKQLQQVMEQVGCPRVRDLRDHLIPESVPM